MCPLCSEFHLSALWSELLCYRLFSVQGTDEFTDPDGELMVCGLRIRESLQAELSVSVSGNKVGEMT